MDLDVRVISVVGLFNKGKAFLLNKLFGLQLPSGKTQVTQGLSFVYVKEHKMLLVDSPGVQSTVSYKSDSVDRVVDAQSTETFIFELVSQISDHIIFVVNDFTSFEQAKVQMFEKKEQSQRSGKPARELIVVHNLCDTQTVEDAEKLFRRQITSRYDGVESHLGKLFFIARGHPPVTAVHHFAICQDGSPAGKAFNHNNFQLLLAHLEHAKKFPERLVLTKLINQKMDDFVPRFFLKSPGERRVEYRQSQEMETIPEEDELGDRSASYRWVGYFHIECEKLEMKRQGVLSELGEVVSHDKSFSPDPAIYDEKHGEYLWRTIQIECPGVKEEQVNWEEGGDGLTVTIEKSKLVDEGAVTMVEGFPLRQQSGIWKKLFHFADGPFELVEDECALEYGVLKLQLKKCLMSKRGGLKARRAETIRKPDSFVPSSLPSEAEGLYCDPDAHPVQHEHAMQMSQKSQSLDLPDSQHCLTVSSWVLTDQGPKLAADAKALGETPLPSVALSPEDAEDAEEPKNGMSPAWSRGRPWKMHA